MIEEEDYRPLRPSRVKFLYISGQNKNYIKLENDKVNNAILIGEVFEMC